MPRVRLPRSIAAIDGPPADGEIVGAVVKPALNKFKRFDVRSLIRRGVEPCAEIQKRIGALRPGEGLIIIAPFLPSPLIEKLGSEGFTSKVERGAGADWMVYFWREAA